MSDTTPDKTDRPKRRRRTPRPPKLRNCKIYERHIVEGQTQEQVAAAFGITQQRVGQIAARVEAWIATHANHPLAQRMRLRASRRWEAIWSRAIDSFDRSREDRETTKERATAPTAGGDNQSPMVAVTERTIRQQNGDPRFLTIATASPGGASSGWPKSISFCSGTRLLTSKTAFCTVRRKLTVRFRGDIVDLAAAGTLLARRTSCFVAYHDIFWH